MRRLAKAVTEREWEKAAREYSATLRILLTSGRSWVRVVEDGRNFVNMVMSSVRIPANKQKAFDRAAKLVYTSRRTRDVDKWVARNKKLLLLLKEATEWEYLDEAVDAGDRRFPVADFTVHNLVGLTGDELTPLKILVAKSYHLLRKSKVKGIRKALYGEVHLVGQLLKKKSLAWYDPRDDTIYVRPFARADKDAVHSLMHEIGHRFWKKFTTREKRIEWFRHHIAVLGKKADPYDVHYPSIGETISIAKPKGRGRKRKQPVVVKIEGQPGAGAKFYVDERRFFTDKQFQDAAATEAGWKRFPTPYSSSSEEEHFCEALALWARGALDRDHAEAFERIWGGGTIKMGALRLAHEVPGLRRRLVPLLRVSGQPEPPPLSFWGDGPSTASTCGR
jgi:hypothetical protein